MRLTLFSQIGDEAVTGEDAPDLCSDHECRRPVLWRTEEEDDGVGRGIGDRGADRDEANAGVVGDVDGADVDGGTASGLEEFADELAGRRERCRGLDQE